LMSIPDSVVGSYALLAAALHPREVAELERDVAVGGPAASQAKRRVAFAVVALYHGPDEAAAAEERFDATFRRREVPQDADTFPVPDGDPVHLPALLVAAGMAASTSAARRDIDSGAVRLDGTPLTAREYDLPRARLVGRVLTSGRRRAARLVEPSSGSS
jgi:tyrosyl-tRNA synthetase